VFMPNLSSWMCCGRMSHEKLCGKRSKSIPLEIEDLEKL
jgi:Undecaprenyl pyrophosphate synthase